jgi:hypothetical protein
MWPVVEQSVTTGSKHQRIPTRKGVADTGVSKRSSSAFRVLYGLADWAKSPANIEEPWRPIGFFREIELLRQRKAVESVSSMAGPVSNPASPARNECCRYVAPLLRFLLGSSLFSVE